MLTWPEIARGGYGAWRLLLGDARGLEWLDRSPTGVWRSFRLAVLLLPAYALLVWLHLREIGTSAPLPRVLFVEISAYAISWTLFPLIMTGLGPMIDRERETPGFIVAYNWANLINLTLYLPIALLNTTALLPEGLMQSLDLVFTVVFVVYGWFIFKTALNLSGLAALPLAAADFVLSIFIAGISDALIR
ncbi:MAG: hypothetical protein ACOY3L_12635 [Pseudomonadota bacterium]